MAEPSQPCPGSKAAGMSSCGIAPSQRSLASQPGRYVRDEAERQKETAERQRRLSLAEGLAANALAVISGDINDPSLALILARPA